MLEGILVLVLGLSLVFGAIHLFGFILKNMVGIVFTLLCAGMFFFILVGMTAAGY